MDLLRSKLQRRYLTSLLILLNSILPSFHIIPQSTITDLVRSLFSPRRYCVVMHTLGTKIIQSKFGYFSVFTILDALVISPPRCS